MVHLTMEEPSEHETRIPNVGHTQRADTCNLRHKYSEVTNSPVALTRWESVLQVESALSTNKKHKRRHKQGYVSISTLRPT
jgi:hypothetical protein